MLPTILILSACCLAFFFRLAFADESNTPRTPSPDHLTAICNAAPVGLYSSAPDGSVLFVNDRLVALTGTPREQFLGTGWQNAVHPEDRARAFGLWEDAVRTRKTFHAEFRLRSSAGGHRWGVSTAYPRLSETGELIGFVGSFTDIDDLHRHEQDLRNAQVELERRVQSRTAELEAANARLKREVADRLEAEISRDATEQRLQEIIDRSPAVIYVKLRSGRYAMVNRRFVEIFSFAEREILGRTDREMFIPEIAEAFQANDRRVFESGESIEFEELVPQRDGATHTYISLKFPLKDADGEPYAVCGISTDITDRKRTQQRLAESRKALEELAARQRTLIENTSDFLFQKDIHGNFTYVSPAVETILGYSAHEWMSDWSFNYHELITDAPFNEKARKNRLRVQESGATNIQSYTVELRHKAGVPVVLEVRQNVVMEGGVPTGVIGVARDVTDRVRAHEELERAKVAAEAASRAKSAFLANMSHELRTPIMAMLSAAGLLENHNVRTHDAADLIAAIRRNGNHLLSLVNSLLDVARVESEKIELNPEPYPLDELFADLHAATIAAAGNTAATISFVAESDLPSILHIDPVRLRQALINLLSNAIKFTKQGEIQVRFAAEPVPAQQVNHSEPIHLSIAIADTGIGIPPERHEEIFSAFAQVAPISTGPLEGLGLGLPLARHIAERMDGTITLDSAPGGGSTFTFHAICEIAAGGEWREKSHWNRIASDGAIVGARREPPARFSGRVLLAEDFDDTRKLVKRALESHGAEVVAVSDGNEAIEATQHAKFDLILLDVRMPNLDGIGAVRALREKRIGEPIIALTASHAPERETELLAAGFDEVWRKPLSLPELLRRVSSFLPAQDSNPSGPAAQLKGPALERLEELRQAFATDLPPRAKRVMDAIDSGRIADADAVLHGLIGAAGMHGFEGVSSAATELLEEIRAGSAHAGSAAELRRICDAAALQSRDRCHSESAETDGEDST